MVDSGPVAYYFPNFPIDAESPVRHTRNLKARRFALIDDRTPCGRGIAQAL